MVVSDGHVQRTVEHLMIWGRARLMFTLFQIPHDLTSHGHIWDFAVIPARHV